MSDLVEFYRARLDEDEQAAREAAENLGGARDWAARATEVIVPLRAVPDPADPGVFTVVRAGYDDGQPVLAHVARHDPARVLADVEADRKLISAYLDLEKRVQENVEKFAHMIRRPSDHAEDLPAVKTHGWELRGRLEGLTFALQARAERFADHPDYQEAWRP